VSANKNPALLATQAYFQDGRLRKISQRFGQAHISQPGGSGAPKWVPLTR
jgi:hypothetical protein